LTDGEDNSSTCSVGDLQHFLSNPANCTANVIVIGIGSDVRADILEAIAKSTQKGVYIFAKGDKSSIDDAFGEVISVIEGGQVIVED
jgi:hypothetical protein